MYLVFRFCVVLASLGICHVGVAGTNYFVSTSGSDANTGLATANAFATIQRAMNVVGPGDTVTVSAGEYAGFRGGPSGTPGNLITVRAELGAAVILNTLGTNNTRNCILEVVEAGGAVPSYWRVEGFTVAGSPRHAIGVFGHHTEFAHDIEIVSNTVHSSTNTGIYCQFTHDILIEGNHSYSNGEHGVYCANSGDRPTIRGNYLYDNVASGLHMNGDVSIGAGHPGVDGIISDISVLQNRIHGNGQTGGSGVNLDGIDGGIVANNVIYNEHASGISLFKVDGAVATRNVHVLHNTVLTAWDGRWAVNVSSTGAIGNVVMNNILLSGHAWIGSISVAAPDIDGFESNFNVLMDRISVDDGSTAVDLDVWQGAGHDHHSMIATRTSLFMDEAGQDLRLKSAAPAVDKGTFAGGILYDITNGARPLGCGPDIGAYESE